MSYREDKHIFVTLTITGLALALATWSWLGDRAVPVIAIGSTPTPVAICEPIWSVVESPNPGTSNDLAGVDARAANDVWAVGGYSDGNRTWTLVEHWDGYQWSVVFSPAPTSSIHVALSGVAALAPDDVWAVGQYDPGSSGSGYHTLAEHWDGYQWSIVATPDLGPGSAALLDIDGVSIDDVWAVGHDNNGRLLAEHWDGDQWSRMPTPDPGVYQAVNELRSVEAISSNDVWAVGYYLTAAGAWLPIALHWDGLQWTQVSVPISGGDTNLLYGVSAVSSTDVWAVGHFSDPSTGTYTLTLHWDGTKWSITPSPNLSPNGNFLFSVEAVSANDVWAVGQYTVPNPPGPTLVMHWDGIEWGAVSNPNPGTIHNIFWGVSAVSTHDVWAVGNQWDGSGSPFSTLIEHYADPCVTPTPSSTPTSTVTATPTICTITFSDVDETNPFSTWIRCLACRNIISGYSDGTFRPGNDITRGQIAKIVSNSAGFSEDAGPQIYEDVPVSSPFYDWINRLSMRGHMGGYLCGLVPEEPCISPDNRPYFRPNASATRGQLAKIVSNAAGLGGDPTGLFYTDVPEEHPFYVWIMRLTQLGAMSGYPCGGEGEPCDDANRPYFRPFANVTRGQASKIVANTFFPNCQTPQRP